MKHLIHDEEAIAMLETVGASKEIVKKFAMQLGGVLSRRPYLGDDDLGVTCTSLAGARSGNPGVNVDIHNAEIDVDGKVLIERGPVRLQLDIKSAQDLALNILGCAEAAISDVTVLKLLTGDIGLDINKAGHLLMRLRELRQGSRKAVFPQ